MCYNLSFYRLVINQFVKNADRDVDDDAYILSHKRKYAFFKS